MKAISNKTLAYLKLYVGVVLAGSGCQGPEESPPTRPVKTIVLEEHPFEIRRVYQGRVVPGREAAISFRVPGELQSYLARIGRVFEEGEVVAELDPRDFRTRVRQIEYHIEEAEANLDMLREGAREEDRRAIEARLNAARIAKEEARRLYEQHDALYREELIARSEYEELRTAYAAARSEVEVYQQELRKAREGGREEEMEAARAAMHVLEQELETARAAESDTVLKSPFRGVVTDTLVENHQFVTAGLPVVVLQDLEELELTFGIPEQTRIHADRILHLSCRIDSFPGVEYPGEIIEMGTDAERLTRTYPVTVRIVLPPEHSVLPGMTGEVDIRISENDQDPDAIFFAVPPDSVVTATTENPFVWLVDEEQLTVSRKDVRVEHVTDRRLLIHGELYPGSRIVAAGAAYLEEGQKIRLYDEASVP